MSTAFNDVPVEGATCVEEAAPLGVRLKRNFNYSFGQALVCTQRFWEVIGKFAMVGDAILHKLTR